MTAEKVEVGTAPADGRIVIVSAWAGVVIAFGWGFAVAFGVYISAGISGAHLNPAVTLTYALRRGFAWTKVPAYWLAQVVGAFAPAALVYAVYRPAIPRSSSRSSRRCRCVPRGGTWFSNYWWVPVVGPLIGGPLGILVYDALIASTLTARARGGNRRTHPGGRPHRRWTIRRPLSVSPRAG